MSHVALCTCTVITAYPFAHAQSLLPYINCQSKAQVCIITHKDTGMTTITCN